MARPNSIQPKYCLRKRSARAYVTLNGREVWLGGQRRGLMWRVHPATGVMRVFSEATTRVGAERQAYLERACGGDATLRAEVESLLAIRLRLGHFLESLTIETQIDAGELNRQADAEEPPPS
jgi:hypothetical protein